MVQQFNLRGRGGVGCEMNSLSREQGDAEKATTLRSLCAPVSYTNNFAATPSCPLWLKKR
jgi:hypothetical protein